MAFALGKRAASPRCWLAALASIPLVATLAAPAGAQIDVLTVDCTPFVSPGGSSFGATHTMGMALQAVDQGSDFNVTEVTPQDFRNLTAEDLKEYDLIAVNNHPGRINDNCGPAGSSPGLGATWHDAVGVEAGGRVVLTSHDAPRFKLLRTPPAGPLNSGFEPFGTVDFVRQAALWAGGVPGTTGLLIFNDAARFTSGIGTVIGGVGWDNPELNLPLAWGIVDLDQAGGNFMNGGYTDILPAFASHPIYDGTAIGGVVLSDVRGAPHTLSSFSANIGDTSFHSVFDAFNALIFTPTEVVINAGIVDVDGLCFCTGNAAPGPDGKAITLIREAVVFTPVDIKPQSCPNPLNGRSNGVLPVAILGTADFDVSEIDPATVRLEGVAPLRWAMEDVATPFEPYTGKEDAFDCTEEGADGFMDLTLKFDTQEVYAALGMVAEGDVLVLMLTGDLMNGTAFQGEDVMLVVKTPK